jgi:hypothetical protein
MNTQQKIDALNAQFATIHKMAIENNLNLNAALDAIESQIWELKSQLENEVVEAVAATLNDLFKVNGYFKALGKLVHGVSVDAVNAANQFHNVALSCLDFKVKNGRIATVDDVIINGSLSIQRWQIIQTLQDLNLLD